MPITRYAVIKNIEYCEELLYQTVKIFATKSAAEKYSTSLLAKSIYDKFQNGEVITSIYDWTEKSKELFFQYLDKRNIFPKENFNENDVIEVNALMIDMIKWKELESIRFIYDENVEEWFRLDEYSVKPLNHF
ncbi:hypothetical protein V9L05_12565 [Bernardetia sp. Wsw4-3y2]|uniref:hypothetical protein n=1 Tax=Bernardetia sp. Wsw4-3y2 TaxID=3127471 RepID=UPI0030CF9ED0